jgi:Glycosyl transferase family 2
VEQKGAEIMSAPAASVTIGIPCFNCERWLRDAIASALAQTWSEKEVIVADDGSTDRSREIAREFGVRVRLIETDHRGGNHARNEILRHAKGDWIQYLDADDFLLPEKIARQFSEAGDLDACDVIYSPTLMDEAGKCEPSELDPELDIFAQWIAWQLPQTSGCLWRKQALERLGGWNETMPCCQEHELYLRAIQAGLRFRHAPTAKAIYRIWSNETVCRRDPCQVVRVKTKLLDELRAWMAARGLWHQTHAQLAGQACFEMSRTMARFDLTAARAYHKERKAARLIHLRGPAAPATYRWTYRLLGFQGAEKVARALR